MFDRAIIENEKFVDMPVSSKALYFLLGMDADDEGFVSAKKILRIHGGSDDDLNVLLAKGFCIKFPSGIVVITHWHENNYLDKNRMKRTQYEDERSQLLLTSSGKYEFNNGLTSIEERSVEQLPASPDQKKNMTWNKYDESNPPGDVPEIDPDGNSLAPKVAKGKDKLYFGLLGWAAEYRGSPFMPHLISKQFKAFSNASRFGLKVGELKDRWREMSEQKFYQENGFDWMDVVNSFNKRPK